MGKQLSTFCFKGGDAQSESEVRALGTRAEPRRSARGKGSPPPPDSSRETLSETMKRHIDSIKDLKDDLLNAEPEAEDVMDGSFTLIINKAECPDAETGPERPREALARPLEYLRGGECSEVDETDLADFLQPRATGEVSGNLSLVREPRALSAIKERSEHSEQSHSRAETRQSSAQGSGAPRKGEGAETDLRQQLKEIEELNLLQVSDSFEVAGDERSFASDSSGEAQGPNRFLEDAENPWQTQQRKSDFQYFCSEKAKSLTQRLEQKPQVRQMLEGAAQRRPPAQQFLEAKRKSQRKSARKSAQSELRLLIQKVTAEAKAQPEKENRGELNEEYCRSDALQRKSQQLLTRLGRRVSNTCAQGSEAHLALVAEVERFYADLISRNLAELGADPARL